MDRLTVLLFSFLGISFIFMDKYSFRGVVLETKDYPIFKIFGGLIALIFIYIFFKMKKIKNKSNYSKCPKCKEIFESSDLENGKCKYCKDIDTIDLDKYFELSPKELTKRKKGNSQK